MQMLEELPRVWIAGETFGQRGGDLRQKSGAQQHLPRIGRLLLEQCAGEVVEHRLARFRFDRFGHHPGAGDALEHQGESGRPPFGLLEQLHERALFDRLLHRCNLAGLVQREPQVRPFQRCQPAGRSVARECAGRIGSADAEDIHCLRDFLEQRRQDGLKRRIGRCLLHVVQHQQSTLGKLGEQLAEIAARKTVEIVLELGREQRQRLVLAFCRLVCGHA